MRYALDIRVPWESRHWGVNDCRIPGLTARVTVHIREVCSWNGLK